MVTDGHDYVTDELHITAHPLGWYRNVVRCSPKSDAMLPENANFINFFKFLKFTNFMNFKSAGKS